MQHTIHLMLWDIDPSPAIIGEEVSVKVGAKCVCGCNLAGELVSIRDGNGVALATGRLQAQPLPGTVGLFWREIKVPAPTRHGEHSWSASLAADNLHTDHKASAEFSVRTGRRPEHLVTVVVMKREGMTPLAAAEIRLGALRATSDERGVARFMSPPGTFDLSAWKVGYRSPVESVEVNASASLTLLVSELEVENPDDDWC